MSFKDLLGPDVNVIEDSRASKRGKGAPESVTVVSSRRIGGRSLQIDELVAGEVVPVAFIDASNNVWVLSAGASGLIVYESSTDEPASADQQAVVDAVEAAVKKHFNLKTKRAKKEEPDTVLGVVEPEFPTDWPDMIADVDLAD